MSATSGRFGAAVLMLILALALWPHAVRAAQCDDAGLAERYLSEPVDRLTPEVIATFVLSGLIEAEAPSLKRFWSERGLTNGDLLAVIDDWNASEADKAKVRAESSFLATARQFFATLVAFESARQSTEQAVETLAGAWDDWRARYMTREAFVGALLEDAADRRRRGVAARPALLQAAQAMLNRLDDLHGAAGSRPAPESADRMWFWDRHLRWSVAAADITLLERMNGGAGLWQSYVRQRERGVRCAAADLPRLEAEWARMAEMRSAPALAHVQEDRCDRVLDGEAAIRSVRPFALPSVVDAARLVDLCLAEHVAAPQDPAATFRFGLSLGRAGRWEDAVPLFREAAEAGHPAAQRTLGVMYLDPRTFGDALGMNSSTPSSGRGSAQSTGIDYLIEAARAGDPMAIYSIGWIYERGEGTTRDPAEALRWYRRAAEAGYVPAFFGVGSLLLQDAAGTAESQAVGLEALRSAAREGFAPAMLRLGTIYEYALGPRRDMDAAKAWYQAAAEAGDPDAAFALKQIALTGSSAASDSDRAEREQTLGAIALFVLLIAAAGDLSPEAEARIAEGNAQMAEDRMNRQRIQNQEDWLWSRGTMGSPY